MSDDELQQAIAELIDLQAAVAGAIADWRESAGGYESGRDTEWARRACERARGQLDRMRRVLTELERAVGPPLLPRPQRSFCSGASC